MNLEDKFLEIIERKHKELNLGKNYNEKFSKVRDFEANAIGQIGEEYIKYVISSITNITFAKRVLAVVFLSNFKLTTI